MKKIGSMHTIIVLMALVSVPLMPMDALKSLLFVDQSKFLGENGNCVRFTGQFSIVEVEKSHVPLIRALCPAYKKHKQLADSGRIIPPYNEISTTGLSLVNDALKVRPDKFSDYYNQLTLEQRMLLIKSSGQYDYKGRKRMLDVPEITKRLIDVYFCGDLHNRIKHYFNNEDEDFIRSYCKEQLIASKRLLILKERIFSKLVPARIREDIYLGSFFMNAGHTINQYDYPIYLSTQGVIRKIYATSFGSDNREYRITDVDDNQCILWVINHNNPSATFSTPIMLKGAIEGCRLSSTNTDVEYAVIYSEHDMVLAEINRQTEVEFVNPITVDIPQTSTIVDVCFDPTDNTLVMGLYEGLQSVIMVVSKSGKLPSKNKRFLPFKSHGLLEKITIYPSPLYQSCVVAICGVADQHSTIAFQKEGDSCHCFHTTRLSRVDDEYYYELKLFNAGKSTHMYDMSAPFFMKNNQEKTQSQQTDNTSKHSNSWLFDYISTSVSSVLSQPESEIHRVYSPDGAFLMCNSIKKKLGLLYVETVLKDPVTHKQILSIDTLYHNFVGVGFSPDGTELIFVNNMGSDDKVSLLNEADKSMLHEFEKLAFSSCGVTSLLKRLCEECRDQGIITLHKDEPTHCMLKEWIGDALMLQFLQKCLPIKVIKK